MLYLSPLTGLTRFSAVLVGHSAFSRRRSTKNCGPRTQREPQSINARYEELGFTW